MYLISWCYETPFITKGKYTKFKISFNFVFLKENETLIFSDIVLIKS